MDSISSIAKNHCHCNANMICGILFTLLAVITTYQAVSFTNPAYITLSIISIIITLFLWIYISGAKIGCTLIRIPLIIITILGFISSLFSVSIGILFATHDGVGDYINSILHPYGYRLAIDAGIIGLLLIVSGILVFVFSFCLLSGARYFDSVKSCLDGAIKRGGARIFGVSSIIGFIALTIAGLVYLIFLMSSGQLGKMISGSEIQLVVAGLITTDLILLVIGLSVNSFANQTYAFRMLENQMMKIETNADGTVYVPINDEFEYSSYTSENSAEKDGDKNHKPFISEEHSEQSNKTTDQSYPTDEKDII